MPKEMTPQDAQQAAIDAAEELAQSAFDNYLIQQDYGTNYREELFPGASERERSAESAEAEFDARRAEFDAWKRGRERAPDVRQDVDPRRLVGAANLGAQMDIGHLLREYGNAYPGLAELCAVGRSGNQSNRTIMNYLVSHLSKSGKVPNLADFKEDDLKGVFDNAPTSITAYAHSNHLRKMYREILCLQNTPAALVVAASPTLNAYIDAGREARRVAHAGRGA